MSKREVIFIVAVVSVGAATPIIVQHQTNDRLQAQIEALRSQLAASPQGQQTDVAATGNRRVGSDERIDQEHTTDNSPPPASVLDTAVDWQLRHIIRGYNNPRKPDRGAVYRSYRITNHYIEHGVFVYDFDAECFVCFADTINSWLRADPDDPTELFMHPELRTFSVSLSFVRKGQKWYYQKTVR